MRTFLVTSILTVSVYAFGQSWTVFDQSNSGLPSDRVQALVQDLSGDMWIGTDFGLIRFDGANWTVYQTSNSPLPDNDIRALSVDSSGMVWVGTFLGGLASYDNGSWTLYNNQNSGLPENQVKCIAADSSSVWVGTIGGLAHFDGTNWFVYDDTPQSFNDLRLPSSNVAAVAVRPDGLVCIGTVNGGFTYLTDSIVEVFSTTTTGLPDNTTLGVAIDAQGYRWAACPSGGLLNHSAPFQDNVWFQYATTNSAIPSNSLNALDIARSGLIYIATQITGLAVFDPPFNWSVYNNSNSGLPDDVVLAVHVDDVGMVWCGTEQGGLALLDPQLSIAKQDPKEVVLYPIPASDEIWFSFESPRATSARIIDSKGKLTWEGNLMNDQSLDLSSWETGVYMLLVEQGGLQSSSKFIVR